MRIEGLKDGIYDSYKDVFLDPKNPEVKSVLGKHIVISDGKISGSAGYGRHGYNYWLFYEESTYDLKGSVGLPGGCSSGFTRTAYYNASISFDESYMNYLTNHVEYLRDKYSEMEHFRAELEISRFLIKEMRTLINYKETIHDIPVRRHLYTDRPDTGFSVFNRNPSKSARSMV